MKTVRFEYKERGSVKYITSQIPERLSEATGQQFTALLALAQGRIAEEPFFLSFFGIPEKVLHRLDLWQLYVLTEQLRDIWKAEKIDHFPIEVVIVPWNKEEKNKNMCLQAPGKQLKGMSFQQFMTVDQFYQWYVYTGKQQYLMAMVAALYIEKGKDFKDTDISYVSQRLEESPHRWLCEGLAFNWSMIRAWLSEAYTHLFPSQQEDGEQKKAAPTVKQRPGSWLNIFDTLFIQICLGCFNGDRARILAYIVEKTDLLCIRVVCENKVHDSICIKIITCTRYV